MLWGSNPTKKMPRVSKHRALLVYVGRRLLHYDAEVDRFYHIVDAVVDGIDSFCIGDVELSVSTFQQQGLHVGVEVYERASRHVEVHLAIVCILISVVHDILQSRYLVAHLYGKLVAFHLDRCAEALLIVTHIVGIADGVCIRELDVEEDSLQHLVQACAVHCSEVHGVAPEVNVLILTLYIAEVKVVVVV